MSISLNDSAFVESGGSVLSLGQAFSVSGGANPSTLVLSGVDLNAYPAGASQATGSLTGANGVTVPFFTVSGAAAQRAVDVLFTYQPQSGRYYNSVYGYFDQISYKLSASTDDLISFSLFASSDSSLAGIGSLDPATLDSLAPQDFVGSTTIFTNPAFTLPVPTAATPSSLAAVALSFIGQTWNLSGCWNEAAAIAAEAGAGLPVAAAFTGLSGQKMGEWQVAFDGTIGQTGDWRSLVRQGDVIALVDADGVTGHITTCVAGSGAGALLVDDAELPNSKGGLINAAPDGNADDITITPLLAGGPSGEFNGVATKSVVIYRLDTPVISDLEPAVALAPRASVALSGLFSATSPDGHAVTQWQLYTATASEHFQEGGVTQAAHDSAATALSVASLNGVSLVAGSSALTDSILVRGYNGSYWGDWQGLDVEVGANAAPLLPAQASSDSAVLAFIAGQNATTRGSQGVGLLNNGIVGSGDSVIGEMSAALGSGGVNAMLLDNDISAYAWQIDATGTLHLFDGASNRSYTVTGLTDLLFDGGAQGANGQYDALLMILDGPDSEVARFYQAALGRVPDLPGMEYWIDQVAGGLGMTTVAGDFFDSAEFTQRFGAQSTLSDSGFVTLLYQNVLQRTPTASELGYYISALSGGEARVTLFLDFANSQELINDLSPSHGGWLVDTALGGNTSSGDQLDAGTVLSQAVSDNYLDTALINPNSLAVSSTSAGGLSAAALGSGNFSVTVSSASPGFTLLLSAAASSASLAISGATVYSASHGGDSISFSGAGGTDMVILAGGGNRVALAAGSGVTLTVSGFTVGSDHVDLSAFHFASYAALLTDASVSAGSLQIHGGPGITLAGVSLLSADDFLL